MSTTTSDIVTRLRETKLLSQRNQLELQQEAAAEIDRLRKLLVPQWFYADGYSSEDCADSTNEVIWNKTLRPGKHVVRVDCAGPMPSIWCAVHVLTDVERETLETDDDEIVTEFASEAEAIAHNAAPSQIEERKDNG